MTRGKPKDGSKNPGGRPVEWTEERIAQLADSLDKWSREHTALFMASWLAQEGLYWDLVPIFCQRSEKFSEANKRARTRLEAHLAEGAITGELEKTLSIFALKQGENGWKDKQDVNHSGALALTNKYQVPDRRKPG